MDNEAKSVAPTDIVERSAAAHKVYADAMAIGFEQARLSYEQSQQAYAQELNGLYGELNDRSQQALQVYGQALAAAYTGAPCYEDCVNEYRAYVERMQQLFGAGDAAQRHQAAYQKLLNQLSASTQPADTSAAAESYQREVQQVWNQQSMREQLENAQSRYLELLKRLSTEASERQAEAWKALLDQLREIWSQQDLATRAQGSLERLMQSAREALMRCHAAVEKSSSKAVEALAAAKS